jgi:hypothetical protein
MRYREKRERPGDMNVTLSLSAEVERNLTARARARGVSLDEYLQELVAREAGLSERPPKQFDNPSDLLLNSPFAGANLDLERPKNYPRPAELG